MTEWWVVFLPEVEGDFTLVSRADHKLGRQLQAEILREFHEPFKADRFLAAVEGRARTSHIDRLERSGFPESYRLQLSHDHRATLWLARSAFQGVITHVFAKSADPNYRTAMVEHDRRLADYLLPFRRFVDQAERRGKPKR